MPVSTVNLKKESLRMYGNTHIDNQCRAELLRCIRVCNDSRMVNEGWQFNESAVRGVYNELAISLGML